MTARKKIAANRAAAPQWLSLQQAAATYGVSTDTIRRRVASGALPAVRCGRRIIRVKADDLSLVFHEIPTVRA